MKKITVMLSFIMMVMLVGMTGVKAAETTVQKGSIYGDITMDSSPFTSSNPVTTEIYYVTKTSSAGYVYMNVKPVTNVSSVSISSIGSDFDKVSEVKNTDGSITVLLKTKSGSAINGTKTRIFEVMANITDVSILNCKVSVSPLGTNCIHIDGTSVYLDSTGKSVTEAEWNASCSNTTTTPETPDTPNPQTGSYVPYVAIGAGIIAIAGVYFYSKKSNKMYRI